MEPDTRAPHRRYNPLTGSWVLVSPHRTARPWQGQEEDSAPDNLPEYDPGCYLCPGNERAGGIRNPAYESTLVFTNDFPALLPDALAQTRRDPLFRSDSAAGTCRVLCFSPRHDLSLGRLPLSGIERVVDLWAEQVTELGRSYRWVQVFENRGAMMGASNPHPHGQVWATRTLPETPYREDANQHDYYEAHRSPLLVDYAQREAALEKRVVEIDDDWIAVVPYWAVWPFETLLLPRRHTLRLPDLASQERASLARILQRLLARYDGLFNAPFPYSMGWHGAPFPADPADNPPEAALHWQLHAHFYPPLLRSAAVRKFMVGYEMLGEPQRDLTPEAAAERLRSVKI